MSEFSLVLQFEKKKRIISLVKLHKNCLEQEEEYISETDFMSRVYGEYSFSEQEEIQNNLQQFISLNPKTDEIIFVNKITCKSGRDIIREVACFEKIKDKILEDDRIPGKP